MALSLSSCLTEYYSSQNTNQGEDADDDDDGRTLKFLWKITKQEDSYMEYSFEQDTTCNFRF